MKIDKFKVIDFAQEPKEEWKVAVPLGSKFLKLTLLPDGIYGWYEVSELATGNFETYTFVHISPDKSVPNGVEYIDTLSMYTEEGVVIFHIYKTKE